MTAISLVCAFVCLVCTIFNSICISKLGKVLKSFVNVRDPISYLSSISSLSSLSEMGNIK